MPMFPLFIDLRSKKCVVIGGGAVAERKVETLLQFDTHITVVSPEITDRIQQLKWEGRVVVIRKKYSEEDLEGAFLVVAATSDEKTNERISIDAAKNNLFVNVADCPERCTFVFPAVVRRDELVVGISTSGGYPGLSKKIRQDIDKILPRDYGSMLETLKQCRERAEAEVRDSGRRKRLLEQLLDEMVLYEGAVTRERLSKRIDDIFEEYADEKGS